MSRQRSELDVAVASVLDQHYGKCSVRSDILHGIVDGPPPHLTIVPSRSLNTYHHNRCNTNKKKLKYYENAPNIIQGSKVSKYCQKNAIDRPAQCRVVTHLQSVRNAIIYKV